MVNLLMLRIMNVPGFTRPVIQVSDDATCLVDSGADTPVWTQGADRLKDIFGDRAEKVPGKKFLLSGFGKGAEIVDVFIIKDLDLKADESADDKEDRIIFKNLTVACTSRPMMVADLILPSSAFSRSLFTIKRWEINI